MTYSAPATTTLPGPKLRELEDQITELAAHIHAADYRFLCLVREFDTAGGWTGPGLRSCAHWLNWKCGIGLNAAREKVRVAHALADHFLNGSGSRTTHGGERCALHIHTDIDTLKASGQGAESSLENAGNVSAETSRRLACDCSVVDWLEDSDGNTLNIGRKSRTIPPAIRLALNHRDKGCRFPGCTAHKHTDAHHIQHWADGGETRLENLVTLCRHHHRAVHEGGFTVKMNANGQPEFCDPNGKLLPPAPETRYRGNAFALITENRRKGLDLTAETCVPDWGGEGMDGDLVVGVLYDLASRRDRPDDGQKLDCSRARLEPSPY